MEEIGFPMSNIDPPRPRRSTLETFNDEMAVLERPLEGDVEYYDEPAPRSAWRRMGMFVVVVGVIGAGGAVVMSRHHAQAAADAQASASAPAPVLVAAAAPAVAPLPPSQAAMPTPAPAALEAAPSAPIAAAEAPVEDGSGDEEEAPAAPVTRSAWSTISGGHAKHGRVASGKTTVRRTTIVKHKVVAKRSARHR